MKRILTATDGSAAASRAVALAARLAHDLHAKLTVLTVSNSMLNTDFEKFASLEHATLGDMIDAEAQFVFRDAKAIAEREGATIDRQESLVGEPADIILEAIDAEKPDAVVVGKRGRGRLEGLLLGSVSQKLASRSPVPVIIVP